MLTGFISTIIENKKIHLLLFILWTIIISYFCSGVIISSHFHLGIIILAAGYTLVLLLTVFYIIRFGLEKKWLAFVLVSFFLVCMVFTPIPIDPVYFPLIYLGAMGIVLISYVVVNHFSTQENLIPTFIIFFLIAAIFISLAYSLLFTVGFPLGGFLDE